MRLLSLAMLLVSACATAPRMPSGASGRPLAPTRYDVKLQIDPTTKRIHGQTAIHFQPDAAAIFISIPVDSLVIEQIELAGNKIPFQVTNQQLTLTVPPGARDPLVIRYLGEAPPGIVFGEGFLYSAYHSCTWMICNDEPGQKAGFDLELELPVQPNLQVIASGRSVGACDAEKGRVCAHWHQDTGYAPYLFGFAAGSFERIELPGRGIPLQVLGMDSPERLRSKFQDTPRMVAFFEEKAGTPLPTSSYAQIEILGDEAQEKSTFSVIGTDEIDPILEDPKEDWVIAHELAHQWWGNSITCKTWPHFWLNEGITTYMVAAYKEQRWGKAAYDHELELLRARYQKAIDDHFDVPLAYSKPYPSLSMKRKIEYSKAAVFLHELRQQMGDEAFWKGFRAYTQARMGTTVESHDFQFELEKATGQDLGALFRKWVYEVTP